MDFLKKTVITRDDKEPYLVRWTIFGCRFFSFKLHHIMQSDDACIHDHPWFFISLILKGGYWEHGDWGSNYTPRREWGLFKKWYGPGSLLFRKAKWRHRLELPPGKTCWTFVITGRPFREWGFWTPSGWVHHENYDSTKQNC